MSEVQQKTGNGQEAGKSAASVIEQRRLTAASRQKMIIALSTHTHHSTTGDKLPRKAADDAKGDQLNEFLKSNLIKGRYQVGKIINSGSFGGVYYATDKITGAQVVMKVALMADNNFANSSLDWERSILIKLQKAIPDASICKLLDQGQLAYADGYEFMVLERCMVDVKTYITRTKSREERLLCVTKIALQMLKGIWELHSQGIIHRDIKPDNMGILSDENPIVVLFDLGTARLYTDRSGQVCCRRPTLTIIFQLRPPRTCVLFNGTEHYASYSAIQGREQTRFDDLFAWFYSVLQLIHGMLPWIGMGSTATKHIKGRFFPARGLLQDLPDEYYRINTHLQISRTNPVAVPQYKMMAEALKQVVDKYGGGGGKRNVDEQGSTQKADSDDSTMHKGGDEDASKNISTITASKNSVP